MSNYVTAHVCMPKPEHILVERGGERSASIEFRHGDEHVMMRRTDARVAITFGVENRASLLRLRDACDEALALLDEDRARGARADDAGGRVMMRRDNPYNTTDGAREADRRYEQRERSAMMHERFAPPTQAALDHLADADAEALDDAAWAHARVRCYADSVDQLAFVAAYKAAVLDEACEDDSQAARDGWRAGRRHRAAPGPRDEQWREEMKAAARGGAL